MNRRNFLTTLSLASTAIALPALALRQDRIVTKGDPNAPYIRLVKNGKQVGLCYWVNLDTREYRRVAILMDFADKPYDGGRIVRHTNDTTIDFGTFVCDNEDGVLGEHQCRYDISGHPIVSYASPSSFDPLAHVRKDPSRRGMGVAFGVSVEGVADEIQISTRTPAHILAQYPDLPRYDPTNSRSPAA